MLYVWLLPLCKQQQRAPVARFHLDSWYGFSCHFIKAIWCVCVDSPSNMVALITAAPFWSLCFWTQLWLCHYQKTVPSFNGALYVFVTEPNCLSCWKHHFKLSTLSEAWAWHVGLQQQHEYQHCDMMDIGTCRNTLAPLPTRHSSLLFLKFYVQSRNLGLRGILHSGLCFWEGCE